MNAFKLFSTQKNILLLLFFVLISGMIFTACEYIENIERKGCRDVEPTLDGEFVECNDCLLEVGNDKLTVKIQRDGNNFSIPYNAVTRYANYDDVSEYFLTPNSQELNPTDLAIVGIGKDAQKLKLTAKGFRNINGNMEQTGTSQKSLLIPDSKDYCQISFLYKVFSWNYDEILYEIELDTGQDEMVRMKLRYIPHQ